MLKPVTRLPHGNGEQVNLAPGVVRLDHEGIQYHRVCASSDKLLICFILS